MFDPLVHVFHSLLFQKGSFRSKASSEFLQLHAQLATVGTAYGLGDSEISAQGRLGASTHPWGFHGTPPISGRKLGHPGGGVIRWVHDECFFFSDS